jgi:hypothetical protein
MRLTYKHENRGLVYSVKNILNMHGIDSHIKNDFGNTMGAEFGIGNTLLELWVKEDGDYERAMEIIEQQLHQEERKAWVCPNCGEENAGQFAVCWNCQTEDKEI